MCSSKGALLECKVVVAGGGGGEAGVGDDVIPLLGPAALLVFVLLFVFATTLFFLGVCVNLNFAAIAEVLCRLDVDVTSWSAGARRFWPRVLDSTRNITESRSRTYTKNTETIVQMGDVFV